ncbi:DUF402 domain-containing protein [Granulicoccus sp. GXG6511]|uniref:DUF402 domain-containing protein n=1 Tax=Granulicoccus sp. GXG6511 TaxID=3381351 RepID=UPI003D7E220F
MSHDPTHGLAPGDTVWQRYRKFDGRPHWQFETVFLGEDEFGRWVGGRPGGICERPGFRFTADAHWVTLLPDDWYVATFNERSSRLQSEIYVDLASPPEWNGHESRAIDLDLDVVRRVSGEVFIADEDEFAAHQVEMGYPSDLVERVRRTADELLTAVRARREPFGSVGRTWLERMKGGPE